MPEQETGKNPLSIFESLAGDYPPLYLNPDTDSQEEYRRVDEDRCGKHDQRRSVFPQNFSENGHGRIYPLPGLVRMTSDRPRLSSFRRSRVTLTVSVFSST